ncbi:MAG: hypothetical protein QGH11_12505, partial [Pirellulaceae bacterium]|nr:hypothetical protein [Pirellulaceae bacterium]
LYSLGSVVYALLTGKPPFSSKVAAQVIHKLRYSDPQPLIHVRQDLPIELDQIVMQLLSKDPSARIPTAMALSHRLQALLHAMDREEGTGTSFSSMDPQQDTDERESNPGSGSIGGKPTKEGSYTGIEEDEDEPDGEMATEAEVSKVDIPVIPPATHYTQVQPGQETGKKSDSRVSSLFQVLVLFVAGILLSLATWYMLQPPSADQLIERIHAAAESADQGSRASNLHARKDIQEFLSRYPDHEQAGRLRQLGQRLEKNQDEDHATEAP